MKTMLSGPFLGEFGPGSRALALGGAYSAIAEDYTASYWNPAGLAQIRRIEFYGDLTRTNLNNQITYQGTRVVTSPNFTRLNSIGLAYPVPTSRGSMVFAFGYNRINLFDDFHRLRGFPTLDQGDFYQEENVNADGSLNQWALSGAVDVSPKISLGASIFILRGENNAGIDYFEEDPNDILIYRFAPDDSVFADSRTGNFRINQDYSGVNLKLGALFRPNNNLRLALNLSTPSFLTVEEHYKASDRLFVDPGTATFDEVILEEDFGSKRKFKIRTPWKMELGAAYKHKLLLVVAVSRSSTGLK